MKKLGTLLTVAAVAVICTPALAAHLDNPNLVVDGGFEGTLTTDGPPFEGTWEGFMSGDGTAEFSTEMPRNGAQSLKASTASDNQFAGVFQDIRFPQTGLEGADAWFSGWHKLVGDAGGPEIRIEWRNSATGQEVTRTPNLTEDAGTDYSEFILATTIPAGANIARVVYAVQSFGSATTQSVFVDDVNFNIAGVPEPTSLVLLGLGGIALVGRRRR